MNQKGWIWFVYTFVYTAFVYTAFVYMTFVYMTFVYTTFDNFGQELINCHVQK